MGFRNTQNVGGTEVLDSAYPSKGNKDETEHPLYTSEGTVRSHQCTFFTQKDLEDPTKGSQRAPFLVAFSMVGGCGGEEPQRRARQQLRAAEVIQVGSAGTPSLCVIYEGIPLHYT